MLSDRVHVPVVSATGEWKGMTRQVSLETALTDLLLYWRSLAYLEWQIHICRDVLDRGWRPKRAHRYLGEKAAEYARQLLDEKYGKVAI